MNREGRTMSSLVLTGHGYTYLPANPLVKTTHPAASQVSCVTLIPPASVFYPLLLVLGATEPLVC